MTHRTLETFLMITAFLGCHVATTARAPRVDATPRAIRALPASPSPASLSPVSPSPASLSPDPLPEFVTNGIDWLVRAQHDNGGWGGGSHSAQAVRDPHAVAVDPGTTAFAALALLRAGHAPGAGAAGRAVQKAVDYLLGIVEEAPADGPFVTEIRGTQPQAKMGQQVDTALCAQLFARLLPELDGSDQKPRVQRALDKCLGKIAKSQGGDGSWGQGGWAPVLQSSLMTNALEIGASLDAGAATDSYRDALDKARSYQQGLVGTAGDLRSDAAAGVRLYASASNMRAVVVDARRAEQIVADAKREGRIAQDAEVCEETLEACGVEKEEAAALGTSFANNELAKQRAFDESLLSGFGNNGGEEYLSYMMKSESLVIDGGEEWQRFSTAMRERLAKVQNQDGSWSGHHCITSPVFCTAAVVACVTADRDVELLRKAAQKKAQ